MGQHEGVVAGGAVVGTPGGEVGGKVYVETLWWFFVIIFVVCVVHQCGWLL